ncbi:MAG: DUF2867 domain-containing protein [Bacteroidales bacterium]|nr:DUF2867 domain-containing protein [Bacteroidales bacterium]
MITKHHSIPDSSLLKKDGEAFNYVDSFQGVILANEQSVDITTVLKLFLSSGPKWGDHLLAIRDKVVALFGLKVAHNKQKEPNYAECKPGEQLGLFKLFDKSENEYVLGETDKHLNFKVSLLLETIDYESDKKRITITTAVKFNNIFGRIYFFPVKPIHGLLVKSTLKNITQQFEPVI